MKKSLARVSLCTFVLIFSVSLASAQDDATGHARQHQIDQSGIEGHIFFVDTGNMTNGLAVLGFAKGLDPSQTYISLLYDNGSVPGGPHACEPSNPDPLTPAQMFVGVWKVDSDGTGLLSATKTGPGYVPLGEVRTISIRKVVATGLPVLQACGEIGRNPQ